MPYWILATTGLSEMKVNSFRRQVKGSGRISSMNRAISPMSIINTCLLFCFFGARERIEVS